MKRKKREPKLRTFLAWVLLGFFGLFLGCFWACPNDRVAVCRVASRRSALLSAAEIPNRESEFEARRQRDPVSGKWHSAERRRPVTNAHRGWPMA
uniref:HDC19232 n=1 Tax=Drosophila melanogaster TaxID=7227 RepID=Q6IIA3_DROME|nr:TPA_inf: HDC19232 [Drosophila melanogaster]